MWNRRDYLMLAAAAVGSFGLTVGMFWSRTATAVDEKPAATVNVKVPTLVLGSVVVSAALESAKERTVVFTVQNTSNEAAEATFTASALVQAPISQMSRMIPMGKEVWKDEYTIKLKAGESRTMAVVLPAAAFDVPAVDPKAANAQGMRPGFSNLMLSGDKKGILALALVTPATTVRSAVDAALVPTNQAGQADRPVSKGTP